MSLGDRAASVGLDAATIHLIADVPLRSVYAAFWGELANDRAVAAIVAAWELMAPEQRIAWLAALDVPAERRRPGRPRGRARTRKGGG